MLMSSSFDLSDLQASVFSSVPQSPGAKEDQEIQRNLKVRSVRRIVDLYSAARKNNRVYKQTYDALNDANPFIRVAAADIIGDTGNVNSFDYLFKALEDEEKFNVRHKIVTAIDKLESRIASDFHKAEPTLMNSMRILSHSN